MVPEAVQNKVITIMDVAIRTYLYKLDGNSFQESYSQFVSLGITLWRLLVKGGSTNNKNKYPGG
jgi:hypothetical protein